MCSHSGEELQTHHLPRRSWLVTISYLHNMNKTNLFNKWCKLFSAHAGAWWFFFFFFLYIVIVFFFFFSVAPPKVQVRAENLTAVFSVHDGNVTALFSWVVAVTRPSQQVTGYQVTWADVTAERRKTNQANSLISQSQILPPVSL